MIPNLNEMLKKAQEMQETMQKAQEELVNIEVDGESGAGLVKIVMNGRHDVKKVTIDPGVLTESKEVLEDLLAAAVNDAVRKVEVSNKEAMSKFTGGLNIPGFKMPF